MDDPALEGPEPDPAAALLATGLMGNPLLVGTAVFIPPVLAPFVMVVLRRAMRSRRGDCPWCGYDIHDLDCCPECGNEAIRSADQPTGTSRPPPG